MNTETTATKGQNMKNQTITIEQSLEMLKESVSASLKMPKVRTIGELPIGGFFRQGDLYVDWGDIANKGALRKQLQLVAGNTTGSRHCVVDSPYVKVYESLAKPFTIETKQGTKIARFPGPLIVALAEWSISHPKHGWMTKAPASGELRCFQTWQQADYLRQRATKD